ncbi:DUF2141 domain-containing protein [uncultured Brevundimonas sp.]|uniref:DUF2141 domain-containing protein n=1 Tax=uncultured Brevundimonas sp. TaxID=213418 RepID=UPI0025CD867D|nr:DUF2141 domain-containing protein [uncultured Brevundimonas sp.]
MFRSISLACAALVVAVGAGAAVAQSRGAALEVRTPGLTAEGSVVVAVFDKEADWKSRDRPVRTQRVAAGPDSRLRIEGLAPGRYGLMVFHDKNNDGRLNTWPIGMPSEPYGFSNNARGRFGPASWQAASFEVRGDSVQTLRLR